MTTLIVVRHGQTDWNINRRFQGHSDIPLNDTGHQQAQALGRRLQNVRFDAAYSSDLSRAMQTAQQITQQTVLPEPRLREIGFGIWEGMTSVDIQDTYPEDYALWRKADKVPEGAESILQVAHRVQIFLNEIKHRHPQQNVLLVAHGGIIGIIICILLDLPLSKIWNFRAQNTSITELGLYDYGNVLLKLNDTCHLIEQ